MQFNKYTHTHVSNLSGDVSIECVRFMPVSWTTVRDSGTVCTSAQREPAHVEPLGAQPSQKGSHPIHRSKTKHSSPARCAHVKRPTGVQRPALQPTNARFTPRRGTAFLQNSGDRYKRHTAQINMVSVTSAVTSTRTSADTRVGAVEHPQISHPCILMNWVARPPRETQPRPRSLQRKVPTKVNSLHRVCFSRGE